MANDLKLAIRIQADIKQAAQEIRRFAGLVAGVGQDGKRSAKDLGSAFDVLGLRSFKNIRQEITQTRAAYRRLADSGKLSAREQRVAYRQMREQVRGLKNELNGVKDTGSSGLGRLVGGAVSIYTGVRAVRGLVRVTDEYRRMNGQLKLVTESEEELADTEQKLFDLAQATRSGYAETVQLYARVARSSKDLQLNQVDLLGVTETINQAIQVSGATAQEAAAGVIQLSQGLAAGALRGEELNSVSEQMPRLMEAIIKGVNRVNPALGLTRKNFRDLAADGKLTTELIVAALKDQAEVIDREFSRLPRTVEQAMTQLTNDFQRSLKEVDMEPLVESIDDLRDLVTDPAFIRGMSDLATAFVRTASAVGTVASEVPGFVRYMAEEVAAAVDGIGADDIVRLEEQAKEFRGLLDGTGNPLNRLRVVFGKDGYVEYYNDDELRAELRKIDAAIQNYYQRNRPSLLTPAPGKNAAPKPSPDFGSGGGDDKADDSLRKFIDRLNQQRDTLGLNRDELLRYQATQAIAAAADKSLADSVRQSTEALIAKRQALAEDRAAEEEFEAAVKASEDAVKSQNAEYQAWIESLDDAARAIRDTLDPMEPLRRELEQLNVLLNAGKLSWDEWAAATLNVQERMDEMNGNIEETTEKSNEFAVQAARNIQSAFADFLFDPFDDGLKGMLRGFVDVIRRMVSEAIAAQLAEKLFGDLGSGGDGGGLIGSFFGSLFHSGGIAGTGSTGRSIPAIAFAGAPRYHTGNARQLLGLKPGEVPSIIEDDEEVLTRNNPRHILNQGGGSQAPQPLSIAIVDDRKSYENYLASNAGAKTMLMHIQQNAQAVKRLLT